MKSPFAPSLLLLLAAAAPATAEELSTSIMHPTAIDATLGRVAGSLPGGEGPRGYYVTVDLKQGQLVTQMEIAGTPNTHKKMEVELLNSSARVAASAYVMTDLDGKQSATKSYAIDSAGKYVIRLNVEGKESGRFCLLMGGTALPEATAAGCQEQAATAPAAPPPAPPVRQVIVTPAPVEEVAAPPPPPKESQVEVIVSKCEERLRVGSDVLFDFDRYVVRPEASPALEEVMTHLGSNRAVIEGHTDGKGTDGYNQTLSERRASAVRSALVDQGAPYGQLIVHGFGKSRPVVPNQHSDGSDDPDGRQKNRRVEIVVNTCS